MNGQGLAGSEVVGSLKPPESPFLVLHHYHYSGQSRYLESKGTGWVKEKWCHIKQENLLSQTWTKINRATSRACPESW